MIIPLTVPISLDTVQYPMNTFEGYNLFPLSGSDGLPVDHTPELGWRQVTLQKVDKRLDELVIMKKQQ